MKRFSVLIIMLCLVVFGCSKNNPNLIKFDNSKLSSQLKESTYHPKLPTQLPFEVKSAQADIQPNEGKVITIYIVGKDGEQMGISIVNRKVEYGDNLKREKVKFGNKKGSYTKNDAGSMTLEWVDSGIHYDLTYFSKQSKKDISKEDLIDTAKSFK